MAEIGGDLARERPMMRLLMGEVGSGKTVVALHAMLRAVEHGAQAALMAPTETLAEQHFATLQALMPAELVQAALLTGSTPAARRADLLGKLASGELKLLVGTHALIEDAVTFDRLAVAVVDEQHRFGVNQRRVSVPLASSASARAASRRRARRRNSAICSSSSSSNASRTRPPSWSPKWAAASAAWRSGQRPAARIRAGSGSTSSASAPRCSRTSAAICVVDSPSVAG